MLSFAQLLIVGASFLPFLALADLLGDDSSWKRAPHQLLQASTGDRHLRARSESFALVHATTLQYAAEDADVFSDSPVAVDVHLASDAPFLVLEDNEHLLRSIKCDGSVVEFTLMSAEHLELAGAEFTTLSKLHVITSHAGCNPDGERSVYSIKNTVFLGDTLTVILDTERVSWREAFPGLRLEFITAPAPGRISRSTYLQRRESPLPSNLTDVPNPLPSRNNATSSNVSTANLAHSLLDFRFGIPGSLVQNNIPLSLSCKKCTTSGSMTLTRGEFSFANASAIIDELVDDDKPLHPLEFGSLQLQMDNFSAHIELETELAYSFEHDFNLFSAPLVGYKVPGFGILGVFLDLSIGTSFKAIGGLEFVYGFDLVVPDNSTVFVNFADINSSFSTGFDQSRITALPLQANLSAVEITIGALMKSAIMIGFEIDEDALGGGVRARAEAGVFINLPNLSATFSILDDSDESCRPRVNLSSEHEDFLKELGNLTHVTPAAEVDLGVEVAFVAAEDNYARGITYTNILLSTSTPLPTACLGFDRAARTFAPAHELLTSVTSRAAESARATQAGAAGRLQSPLPGVSSARDKIIAVGATLGLSIAAGIFLLL